MFSSASSASIPPFFHWSLVVDVMKSNQTQTFLSPSTFFILTLGIQYQGISRPENIYNFTNEFGRIIKSRAWPFNSAPLLLEYYFCKHYCTQIPNPFVYLAAINHKQDSKILESFYFFLVDPSLRRADSLHVTLILLPRDDSRFTTAKAEMRLWVSQTKQPSLHDCALRSGPWQRVALVESNLHLKEFLVLV